MTKKKADSRAGQHPDPAAAAKLTEKIELAPALMSATPIPQPRYPASIPDQTPFPPLGPSDGSKRGTGIMSPKSQGRAGTASPYNLAPAPFSLNQNHVVCLPLVSNHLKLLWACSDQTQELDDVAYLIEAFNLFPYPTLGEMAALAQSCSLHLDQVRVWFMVQRLRFGISWDAEEICVARHKMCGPNQTKEYDKKAKEEKVSEVPPLRKEDDDGSNRSEHSPDSTATQINSLSFESSSPVPRKRRKLHPVVAPNNSNLQHPSPGPQSPPLPLRLVAPPTTLEAPDKAQENVKHQKHCQGFHSELWRSFSCNTNPLKEELQRLQDLTGLHMKYIRKWFCNRRFLLHHRVKADPESEENGQSQPNDLLSSQTQLIQNLTQPPLPTDSRVRPPPKKKRVCQVYDVDFLSSSSNGNHVHGNPAKQIRSNMEGKIKEKEPAEVQKKKKKKTTGAADKETTTRAEVKVCKNELKEERKEVGITKFINDNGEEQVIKMGPRPKNKTIAQLELLRHFFLTCQWPTKGDYTRLQQQTGLLRKALTQWFGDTRYYVKQGLERWMSVEEHGKALAQIREKKKQRQRDWLITEETCPSGSSSMLSLGTVTHSANGESGREEDGAGALRPMNGVKLK